MHYNRICFDINNVLCETDEKKSYLKSKPIKKNIQIVNRAYNQGYIIILYTARYMGRCNGKLSEINKKIKPLTLKQLKKWGIRYHEIYFGKPSFDLFIDDKSLFFTKKWPKLLKKN